MRRLLAVLSFLLLPATAIAQQNIASIGYRVIPQAAAPASFVLGACVGGGPCLGLWSPTGGGNANRPLWRTAAGTDNPFVLSLDLGNYTFSGDVMSLSNTDTMTLSLPNTNAANPGLILNIPHDFAGVTVNAIELQDAGSAILDIAINHNNGTVFFSALAGGSLTLNASGSQANGSFTVTSTTNQLVLGSAAHLTTISSTAPAGAAQTVVIPDSGVASDTFDLLGLSQTISGVKTFSAAFGFAKELNYTVRVAASTTSNIVGGNLIFFGGNGADGDGANPGKKGGTAGIAGGNGGAASAAHPGGTGGDSSFTGSIGGAGSAAQAAGAGGQTNIAGGAAGTNGGGGGNVGGNVVIAGGAGTGAGANGRVQVGSTGNTSGIDLGANGVNTSSGGFVVYTGPAATVAVPVWTVVGSGGGAPAFQNSWVNVGGAFTTARFYKDADDIVHLEGLVSSGTQDTTVFNLPAGFRPANTLLFSTWAFSAACRLDINAAGDVFTNTCNGGPTYLSFGGITFPAEQ